MRLPRARSSCCCAFAASGAASRVDPALRFRMPTEHFIIYFHQARSLAGRLAVPPSKHGRR
jgi:hypothetical protein